jgi:hypothetical protein
MAQVAEHLSRMYETLHSNVSVTTESQRERERFNMENLFCL